MLNEWEEFNAYTQAVNYTVSRKGDTTFLGRFTLESLLSFEGMSRILTILARGYMFQNAESDISHARDALCAWCSIPDDMNAALKQEWQYLTDFRRLHGSFPELVDESGAGWFYRHVHCVADFIGENAASVRKDYLKYADAIHTKFDSMWRNKVIQFQTPIFNLNTKGAWILRFDDILADALELGSLQNYEVVIPDELRQKTEALTNKKTAGYVCDLIAYYHVHKEEDSEWVVLPVTSFDMYYGNSYFSKKILSTIPEEILVRQNHSGTCRYHVMDAYRL